MKTQLYSTYLQPAWCTENLVTEVIPTSEGQEVDKEFNGKKSKALEIQVNTNGKAPSQKDWTLNGTSHAALISLFGDDTKNWLGKIICIVIQKTSSGKDAIYVDKVRTQSANQPKPTQTTVV